jgi:hypothetical protein
MLQVALQVYRASAKHSGQPGFVPMALRDYFFFREGRCECVTGQARTVGSQLRRGRNRGRSCCVGA